MFQYGTLTFHCFGINVPTLVRYTVRKCKLKNIFFLSVRKQTETSDCTAVRPVVIKTTVSGAACAVNHPRLMREYHSAHVTRVSNESRLTS